VYDTRCVFPLQSEPIAPLASSARSTHVRHIVLGLTVIVYMLTYMDRNVLSAATPSIRKELGFSLVTMGWISGAFRWGTRFSAPLRVAWRPFWRAQGAGGDCPVVVCLYLRHHLRLERDVHGRDPLPLRRRRSRRVPDRNALPFTAGYCLQSVASPGESRTPDRDSDRPCHPRWWG
jgi:hypothetical protein